MWWMMMVASAATLTVPTDFATLADAVQAAKDGDTIVLSGARAESVVVDEDLIFEADPGAGGVWSPGGTTALEITGTANVEIRGIVFDGGKAAQRLIVLSGDPTVVLDGVEVKNGVAAFDGGGLLASGDVDLTIRDSVFMDNSAAQGAHVHVQLAERVLIERSSFIGGVATSDGGAVSAQSLPGGSVRILRSWFQGNAAAGRGGAVSLNGVTSANLDANLFCDNIALVDGGAVSSVGNTLGVAQGNVFMENEASGFGGGLYAASGSFSTTNNHFVGNTVQGEGAAIYSAVGGVHSNDLIAYNVAEKKGLAAFYDAGGLLVLDYAALYANAPNSSTVLAANLVSTDPQFVQWGNDPCEPEDLFLQPTSPAIDAGDPAVLDYDGTRSDIGAFGGPLPFPIDRDADGATIPFDCDDDDDLVFPGAEEVCNGLDDDCDGALPPAEEDADDDGLATCEGDCDDTSTSTYPGAPELPGDGIDQDCDAVDLCFVDEDGDGVGTATTVVGDSLDCSGAGFAAHTGDCDDSDDMISPAVAEIECNDIDDDCDASTVDCPPSGCGCASSAPANGWAWGLVGLLLWARRRSMGGPVARAVDRPTRTL